MILSTARYLAYQMLSAIRYCVSMTERDDEADVTPHGLAFTVWALVVGLLLCGAFAGSWKLFGDIYFAEWTRLRIIPPMVMVLVLCVLEFKQLLGVGITAERIVLGTPNTGISTNDAVRQVTFVGVVAVVLTILVKFSLLLAMPDHLPWWPDDWRHVFNPLYPAMHYRVLILLALWGKAGLLVAASTGSQSPNIAVRDSELRRRIGIAELVFNLVLVVTVTTVYFSSVNGRSLGLIVALVIFVVVYLASMFVSRYQGGHDHFSMLACAELGQIALLLGYHAISKYLFQP